MSATNKQVGGDHYKKHNIQPIEFIVSNGLDFLQGSAIKYIVRHRDKGGKEDLLKAIHYCQLMLEYYYGEKE